jgi:hypothetical protein
MSISQEVFKFERIVPIRAKRAVDGEPDDTHPDVDDRGFNDPEFGPVVSLSKGTTVIVRLVRKKIDTSAPLTAVSSDTNVFTVADPANGKLPNTADMDIKITGVDGGGDKKEAKLRVQFAEKDQTITIFELKVVVFKPLDVDVTPHRITIDGGLAKGTAPVADIPKIMAKVKSVWGHYGVNIIVHSTVDRTVTMAAANGVNSSPFDGSGEVSKLLNTDHVPKTINAYFVPQILSSDPNFITLGLGISRKTANSTSPKMQNPGIILADGPASLARSYVMFWANDLAHEIGHFFTLEHVENAQRPNEREDSWSRRMLMHVFNEMRSPNPFPSGAAQFRPRFIEAGYGLGQNRGRRGCMVTLKDLKQLNFDGEVTTARKLINTKEGPY